MKVQNEMATRIAIDTVGAVGSLKGLSNALSASISSWKAQEAASKSSGDSLGAAKAKFEGLSNTIDIQKNKIEELKNRQANLDVENKKDAETYLKLQKDIESATKQLNSYEAQQAKAKQSLDYYSSGLSDLQKGYRNASTLSESFVNRLKAEGNEADADKAKLNGLKQSVANLSEQYKLQETELKKIASESGITSDAYVKQQTRLNETAIAMAKAKTEAKELGAQMNKKPSGFLSGIKDKLSGVNEKAEKTSSLFGKILGANLLANGVINAFGAIKGKIQEVTAAGLEYDKEQQKMTATWLTLTGSAGKAKDMVNTVNDLALKTGQATDIVDELEQGFYHLNSNKKESDELTKSMLNMSDAVGLDKQQIQAVTQDMVNGLSRGKANAGMLNQISQYFPMFREQLAKYETKLQSTGDTAAKTGEVSTKAVAAQKKKLTSLFDQMHVGTSNSISDLQNYYNKGIIGNDKFQALQKQIQAGHKVTNSDIKTAIKVNAEYIAQQEASANATHKKSEVTVADLNKMVKAGLISGKDIEAVFNSLGNGKYDKAAENMLQTMVGMERTIKARMPVLIGAMEKPILNTKNPIYLAISKWVSDKRTEKEFTKVGDATSKGLSTITAAFAKVFNIKNGTKTLDDGVKGLAEGITKSSDAIAKHAPDIVSFFKSAKEASGTGLKIFVQTLKDLEPVLKVVGGIAKDHPKLFAQIAASMLIASKASQGLNLAFGGLNTVFSVTSGLFHTIKFPFEQFKKLGVEGTKANKVLNVTKTSFSTMGTLFKGVGSGIAAASKFAFNSVVEQAKLMGKGLAAIGKAGGKALKFTAKLGWSAVRGGSKLLGKALVGTGKLGAKALKFTAKMTWKAVKSGSKLLGKTLVATGKAGAKALKFTAKVSVKAAKLALTGLLKTAKVTGKGLKAAFNFAKANPMILIATAITAVIVGLVELYKHNKKFRTFVNGIIKSASDFFKGVSKWFKQTWKDANKTLGFLFKDVGNIFKSGFKVLGDYTKFFKDLFTGNWKNLGNDFKNIAKDLWSFAKNIFKTGFDFINKLTGGRLGELVNSFKNMFGKLGGIVSGAIGAVKHGAIGIARGVISPINKMLEGLKSGLNWVLSKVGASEIKASWSIPLPAYAKGTRGAHPGGLALVNDSPTAKYREMYHLPNGQFGMFPKKRNMIVPLPKGAEVLDGESSHQLASMMGLPTYKNGIGSFFSGMWDKTKDIAEEAENILAHPIKFMESVFKKFVGSFGKGFAGDIVTSFPEKIASSATSWVKNLFKDFGGSSAPAGSGAQRWKGQVEKALKATGLSTSSSMINAWLRQIQTESGGNEKAVQGGYTDVNTLSGDLAKGLLQTISATFNAYKMPGHNNIFNGYDNMLAAMRYAKSRYGSDMLSVIGHGHGYANGGLITQHGFYEIGEGNKHEMVIPTDITKRSRAYQLLGEVVTQFAGDKPGVGSNHTDNSNQEFYNKITSQFDTMLTMFGQLLGLNNAQLQAIKASGIDKTAFYKQQALDQEIRNF